MHGIDLHHHWIPEEHVRNVHDYVRAGDRVHDVTLTDGQTAHRVVRDGIPLITMQGSSRYTVDDRIERMDDAGIGTAVLTAATWTSWLDTLERCRFYNDALAERVVHEHPDRFVGAAHVPVGTKYAAAELERCVTDLGFGAVGIATHMHGRLPDEPVYHDLYAAAERLDVPVIVHCAAAPVAERGMGEYDMARTVGRPMDHHIAFGRLIRSDVPEEYPDLTFVHGHLAGTFMFQTFRYGRADDALESRSIAEDEPRLTPDEFATRMANHYFATTFWNPPAIQYATETLGADRMVLGTDYPIRADIMRETTAALRGLDLPDEDVDAIIGGNAAALFDR